MMSSVTVVDSGGTGIVAAGGTVLAANIESGGKLEVLSGGSADPTVIHSGGTEIVSAGGTDDGALISGGSQLVFGLASGGTVFSGAQIVEAHGAPAAPRYRAARSRCSRPEPRWLRSTAAATSSSAPAAGSPRPASPSMLPVSRRFPAPSSTAA